MLEHEPVNPAHHHDRIQCHQQRRHRSAQTKTAVQNYERNCKKRQPDMGAQPALHRPNSPKRNFFPKAEERSENKDRQRDRAKCEAERCAADAAMIGRRLHKTRWQLHSSRQPMRVEIFNVKPAGRDRRQTNEDEPRNVFGVGNAHFNSGEHSLPKP